MTVGLGLLGLIVVVLIALPRYSRPSSADLAEAQARLEQDLAVSEQFWEDCLADQTIPAGQEELVCGPRPSEQGYPLELYLDQNVFSLEGELPAGARRVAVATAILGFLLGVTYVGAEWSTRFIVALVFWETRRLKVVGVKAAVAALAGLVVGAVGQLGWLAAAQVLARTSGVVGRPVWEDYWPLAGRSVLLTVLAALLGFGLTNLTRNTGAALGVAFAYFAVVETALRVLFPRSQVQLISENSAALLADGGLLLFVPGPAPPGVEVGPIIDFTLTDLRAGVTLTAYVAVLLTVGGWLFRRRDLT